MTEWNSSNPEYQKAKLAEAQKAEAEHRSGRLYDDEIIICGHCRAERRARAAKARKAKPSPTNEKGKKL